MNSMPPKGAYSGKRLTIILLIVLLGTGGLFYWVTTSYSSYNAARRQTDRDWRDLATLLEGRYRAIDERLTANQLPEETLAQWRAVRDEFTGTGLGQLQIQSARRAESVILGLPDSIATEDTVSDQLKLAVSKYDQSAQQQRDIGQTLGSRLLKVILNLPDPIDLKLAD